MKEIPIPYVRANQAFIVFLIALAALIQQPWLIVLVFAVECSALLSGPRGNLFVQIAKPFVQRYISRSHTEAAELLRFNTSIAVGLLALSVISFAIGYTTAGYVFAIMVALAALIAICGYCIGCTLYYQFKRLRRR
ncbi:hypothetical protein D3C73_804470 [compost metagenome]